MFQLFFFYRNLSVVVKCGLFFSWSKKKNGEGERLLRIIERL